jgi:hypothetical protein
VAARPRGRCLPSLSLASPKIPLEAGNCPNRSTGERVECNSLLLIDKLSIPPICDVAATLIQRAASEIEKARKLSICPSSEPLGDVRRWRRDRAAYLIAKVVIVLM